MPITTYAYPSDKLYCVMVFFSNMESLPVSRVTSMVFLHRLLPLALKLEVPLLFTIQLFIFQTLNISLIGDI